MGDCEPILVHCDPDSTFFYLSFLYLMNVLPMNTPAMTQTINKIIEPAEIPIVRLLMTLLPCETQDLTLSPTFILIQDYEEYSDFVKGFPAFPACPELVEGRPCERQFLPHIMKQVLTIRIQSFFASLRETAFSDFRFLHNVSLV